MPNPIKNAKNIEACLFVKDVDKKSRDHEKTIRKYQKIIVDKNLDSIIKQVLRILLAVLMIKKIIVILKFLLDHTDETIQVGV